MHIIHLVTRLLRAGSEENTIETCRWQAKAGHRVTVIHGPGHDPYWDTHMPAEVARMELSDLVHPIRPRQDARALAKLRGIYSDLRPDVIHTHQSKAGILGRIAAAAVPQALVVHGIHIVPFEGVDPVKRLVYTAAEKIAARRTDVFIGVSETVGQAYVNARLARPNQVQCVRSGMDLSKFATGRRPPDWLEMLDLHPGQTRPRVALMMAAFEPRKRHVDFLRAFAKIAHRMPDTKLILAGRGPEEARIRSAVADLGLQDTVVLCGHRSDPEALFALADVSVLTSQREGLPRVVVQSLAAGCPPLVQDLPGLGEVIRHGTNGWVTAPGDMAATVDQLQALLTDDALRQRLCKGAKATDLSAWSLDALGAQTTALYALPRHAPKTVFGRDEVSA